MDLDVEDAKKLYNTKIVRGTKKELLNLDYVSLSKLSGKEEKEKFLTEAKIGCNNLAICHGSCITIFVKQRYLNTFILRKVKEYKLTGVVIKTDNKKFVDKLIKFLSNNQSVNFQVNLLPEIKQVV